MTVLSPPAVAVLSVTSVTSVTTSSEDVTDEGAGDGREPSHDPGPSQEFEFAVTDVTDVTDVSEGGSPSLPPILEVLPDISDDDYFRALTQTTGHVEEADQA